MTRLGLLALVLVAGCPASHHDFVCHNDAQCGPSGVCTAASACAFPASDCPSGLRYDRSASHGAGECVGAVVQGDLGSDDMTPSGPLCDSTLVTTLSGNGTSGFVDGTGGPTGTAQFNSPFGMAAAGAYVYVADSQNNRIRKLQADGSAATLAGNGMAGYVEGTGSPTGSAQFNNPLALVADGNGNVFVADTGNSVIRKVAPDGNTSTFAGTASPGFTDSVSPGAVQFRSPAGIALDGAGNLYIADEGNNAIRKVKPTGETTTVAGSGTMGLNDGSGGRSGSATFFGPMGVAVDAAGNLYVADTFNNAIRKIAPNGMTITLAGRGSAGYQDGDGHSALFSLPTGIAVDAAGYIYVVDRGNNRIRRVAPDGHTETLAGNGTSSFNDGPGCTALFSVPAGLSLLGKILYIADSSSARIRKLRLP